MSILRPNRKTGKNIICAICKKEFYVRQHKIKVGKGKYCSKKCWYSSIEFKSMVKAVRSKGRIPWDKGIKRPEMSGKNNFFWKDGKTISKSGYVYIHKPNHPFCNNGGYVPKHRLIMEKHLGRYLTPKEVVHHRGIKYPIGSIENKQDNRIENLQLFNNNGIHIKFHHSLNKAPQLDIV